jgi:hypothetical protein
VILIACVIWLAIGRSSIDRRLLSACLGDVEQANRLVDFELRRRPTLTRKQAASMALARIRRDNH